MKHEIIYTDKNVSTSFTVACNIKGDVYYMKPLLGGRGYEWCSSPNFSLKFPNPDTDYLKIARDHRLRGGKKIRLVKIIDTTKRRIREV